MIGLDLSRCVNDWFGPKCVHKKQVIWGIISTLLPLVKCIHMGIGSSIVTKWLMIKKKND